MKFPDLKGSGDLADALAICVIAAKLEGYSLAEICKAIATVYVTQLATFEHAHANSNCTCGAKLFECTDECTKAIAELVRAVYPQVVAANEKTATTESNSAIH